MTYDVMILGAGVAGSTAAIMLSRAGRKVVQIEWMAQPGHGDHLPEWLSASARGLLDELRIDCTECLGKPFSGIAFHSADLKRTASSAAKEPPAFRIDYPRLVERLRTVARDEGVHTINADEPSLIELSENHVAVEYAETERIEASFLLLADGAGRTLAPIGGGRVPIINAYVSPAISGQWVATLELPAGKSKDAKAAADTNMHWLLAADRADACMSWWWDGSTCVLRMQVGGTGHEVARQLCAAAGKLAEAGIIVGRDAIRPESVALRTAPARSALEIDSHVDKRTLLIGDAGGFVSETSGEGIYPAIWSAKLAVECVIAAAGSTHPQDELRKFSTAWRSTMADFLRAPNTDVHFLLPLIFSNQQMADRMAGAFWAGQNI